MRYATCEQREKRSREHTHLRGLDGLPQKPIRARSCVQVTPGTRVPACMDGLWGERQVDRGVDFVSLRDCAKGLSPHS